MRLRAVAAVAAACAIAAVPAALSSHGAVRDKGPAWSPDGTLIAFNTGEPPEQIWVARPDGTGHRKLTRGGAPEAQPAWSPDGRRIALTSMPAGHWDIYVMDADGGNRTRVVANPAQDTAPAWAPDGSRIAYQRGDEARMSSEIRVVEADGSDDRRLTAGARNESPSWSPDGTRIVFQSTRDGNWELYVMNADGSGVQRLTTTPGRREDDPSWSPDGKRIVFAAGTDHMPRDIYVVDPDGSDERQLTRRGQPVWSPRWSPDGRRIAFFEFPFPGATIYLMNADGSHLTTLFGQLGFGGLTVTPKGPIAGRAFSAILRVTGSSAEGRVTCRAILSGVRIPVASKALSSGSARCTWTLPRGTRGKRLAGSIAVAERGSRVARSFSFAIR